MLGVVFVALLLVMFCRPLKVHCCLAAATPKFDEVNLRRLSVFHVALRVCLRVFHSMAEEYSGVVRSFCTDKWKQVHFDKPHMAGKQRYYV